MATCKYCGQDMRTSKGCIKILIKHNGQSYNPIKNTGGICGDCNAYPGHYHHPGCDQERCPICGDQLISCGCND